MSKKMPHVLTGDESRECWAENPEWLFEFFRDRAITLLELVAATHNEASSLMDSSVKGVLKSARIEFSANLASARNIWWASPLANYLTKPSPVIFDRHKNQRSRFDGSCYHEVAINLAADLDRAVAADVRCGHYVSQMRFHSARGDLVTDFIMSLIADVRCECTGGMNRWRLQQSHQGPTSPVMNWLQAQLGEVDTETRLIPRERFHEYLLSVAAPVLATVDSCVAAGWIEKTVMATGEPIAPIGTFNASAAHNFPSSIPVPSKPAYRILPAVKSTPLDSTTIEAGKTAAESTRASASKLFPQGIPENTNIVDLIVRLDAAKGTPKTSVSIAREFFGESEGNDPKSQSALSQIRRMRRKGRISP